jgi:hypothetical protein
MSHETIADQVTRDEQPEGGKTFERRGLFAAAWAAVAALMLTKTTQPVEAAAGQQFQDTGGGGFVNNSAGGPSALFSNSLYTSTSSTFVGYAFQGAATAGLAGINGSGEAVAPVPSGVYGSVTKASGSVTAGVTGDNTNASGVGVLGRSGSGTSLQDGIGVLGESAGGFGVRGQIRNSNKQAIAVYGENFSTYAGASPGAGGFGVYGYSANGHGLLGATGTAGGAGLVGATNGVANAYAAVMYGPVVITGSLAVVGAKSAAVPHPDGSHRLVYSTESPESWFEDFGKGQLQCGQAEVAIDPDFAAIADTSDYHVFVTVYDQPNDLIVSDRTARGFRVRGRDEERAGEFSWRVVAKRKDIPGQRLAVVAIPPEPPLPERSIVSTSTQPGALSPIDPHRRIPQ